MAPRRGQAVLPYDSHFPEAILEVLTKQARERATRVIPGYDFRGLPDSTAGANDAKVQFIVLIANQALVEEAYLLKHLTPPAPEVNRIHGTFVGRPVPAGSTYGEGALESRGDGAPNISPPFGNACSADIIGAGLF